MSNKFRNIGAPPGTLSYNGVQTGTRIKITLIEFSETEFFEQEFYDLSDCLSHVKDNMIKWINIEGVHKIEEEEPVSGLL